MHFKLFSSFFQFLPLQVEETYFFRDGLNQGLIRFLPPGGRNLPTLTWTNADLSSVSSSDNHLTGVYTKFSGRLSEEPFPWLIQKFPYMLIFRTGQPGCQLNLSEGQIRLDLNQSIKLKFDERMTLSVELAWGQFHKTYLSHWSPRVTYNNSNASYLVPLPKAPIISPSYLPRHSNISCSCQISPLSLTVPGSRPLHPWPPIFSRQTERKCRLVSWA